ncbi:MAG: hypothetical protein A2017_04165 [Lentisphaerae bacterium GWF2_44_16]|nr:MAG: hypothetical protein A2017_04165 [Lentisphaerae bacterium GWF2_44_16]
MRDVAAYYGMKYFIWQKTCGIYNKYSKIIFHYESREGSVNGFTVHFLYAPVFQNNEAFISEKDFLLFIDPILRNRAIPSHKMKTIMLDPGHGAHDKGGTGSIYQEKNLNLQIALKVRDILTSKGYLVYMTRNRDVFLSLEQRIAEAKKCRADIFISIHANIAGKSAINGIETFCVTPPGAPSTNDAKPVYKRERGNYFDVNNARLSYEIHKAAVSRTKSYDRGLKRARFYVIRNAPCPAVLLETGFLSNPKEERALGRQSYQSTLANAIAEGIINYHSALRNR